MELFLMLHEIAWSDTRPGTKHTACFIDDVGEWFMRRVILLVANVPIQVLQFTESFLARHSSARIRCRTRWSTSIQ